jgi:uncharacterized PurR-regulated membrane protein YhhQ (DUF165 family)
VNTDRRPWWATLYDPYGRKQVWRSVETWRLRDSFLLVGLLAVVSYIMVAVALAGLGPVWTLGAGSLALLVLAIAIAEAVYGVRPTQEKLARADRLIVVTFGIQLAMGLLGGLVLLVERLQP